MFRPLRLVSLVLCLSVLLGFSGLRFAAPAPAGGFDNGMGDARFDAALRIYAFLYEVANRETFPDISPLVPKGGGPVAPEVGRRGFGETDMGRSLLDLRARQTGHRPGSPSGGGLISQVQKSLKSMDFGLETGRSSGPPPAEALRLRVGE